MKTKDIYNLALKKAIEADLRGKGKVEKELKRKKEKYEKLSNKKKELYDKESLTNPYLDSRILNISEDKEIKKILVGIDIEPAELLLAKEIGDIDLIISHHPLGKGLANLEKVMGLQCDILSQYGVPINIAEALMKKKMSEVARGVNAYNHQRTINAAEILGLNLACFHTFTDNLVAAFLKERIETDNFERVEDLMKFLREIPEYKKAIEIGAGPKIFVGDKENHCGKVAVAEITGGAEGSPKLYKEMALAGVGTIVGMHISEEHKKKAEKAHINIIIAGHISSDSLGVNLLMDELEKEGIEIVPCSGFTRISRNE